MRNEEASLKWQNSSRAGSLLQIIKLFLLLETGAFACCCASVENNKRHQTAPARRVNTDSQGLSVRISLQDADGIFQPISAIHSDVFSRRGRGAGGNAASIAGYQKPRSSAALLIDRRRSSAS